MFVWTVLGGSSRHYGTTNGLVFEADIFTKVRISNLKTEVIRPKPELHQNASCRGGAITGSYAFVTCTATGRGLKIARLVLRFAPRTNLSPANIIAYCQYVSRSVLSSPIAGDRRMNGPALDAHTGMADLKRRIRAVTPPQKYAQSLLPGQTRQVSL